MCDGTTPLEGVSVSWRAVATGVLRTVSAPTEMTTTRANAPKMPTAARLRDEPMKLDVGEDGVEATRRSRSVGVSAIVMSSLASGESGDAFLRRPWGGAGVPNSSEAIMSARMWAAARAAGGYRLGRGKWRDTRKRIAITDLTFLFDDHAIRITHQTSHERKPI